MSDLNVILAGRRTREWQCIECGFVVDDGRRPGSCPDCNCVTGDFPAGVNLFIRREACGWFE